MAVQPFSIEIPTSVLEDLRQRLARLRWPSDEVCTALRTEDPSAVGLSPRWLSSLMEYWQEGFDWRAQEERLNRFPQVRVDLAGQWVHAVHLRGRGPDPLQLLVCHGWPSSFVEFTKVIPRLTDPAAFGGDEADAFTVVAPSLPGYLFSTPLPAGRSGDTVALYATLMTRLGHARFGVHGGDIGSYVAHRLALEQPERILGVHVTYPAEPPLAEGAERHAEEARFLAERPFGHETGGGYAHMQRSRPLTLAYTLTDSPVGLAAWLLDKWQEWTDCGGDLDARFSHDELLTLVTLYWATGTIGSSFGFYRDWGLGAPTDLVERLYPRSVPGVEPRPLLEGQEVRVPAAVALCHVRYPPPFVARAYADLRRLTVMPRGGHFAALEEPDLVAEDLREFFRPLRTPGSW